MPRINKTWAINKYKKAFEKVMVLEKLIGKKVEIEAQTKAIINTFNKGILLRGRIPDVRDFSGKL